MIIEDPDPGAHGTTWGEIERARFDTEEELLTHVTAMVEDKLDKVGSKLHMATGENDSEAR